MIDLMTGLVKLIQDDPESRNTAQALRRLHFTSITVQLGLWGTYWADSVADFMPALITGDSSAAEILGIIAPIHLGGYLIAMNLKFLIKPLLNASENIGEARGEARGMAKGEARTEAKYENYLERLKQAGVQIPGDIPLEPEEEQ